MNLKRSRTTYLASTTIMALAFAAPALAQQAQDVELNPVIVKSQKAKKAADPASDTPLATQTTAEEIRKREISNIQDLGNTTEPGVDFSKSTDGIVIRGMSGPRVATLVDGIPIPFLQNGARGGSGLTNSDGGGSSFDFASLSAVDILRGADSSRIGSGALGGALILRTLEPEDILQEGRNWGGQAKVGYNSADRSVAGALAVAGRINNTSALLQGIIKKGHESESNGSVGGYGASRTETNPADVDQNNVLFKLRQDLIGGHQIGVTAERFGREVETDLLTDWDRIVGSAPAAGRPDTRYLYLPGYNGWDKTVRERVSLDYKFESDEAGATVENAFAKLYWSRLTKTAGVDGTRQSFSTGVETPYYRDNENQETDIGLTAGANGNFSAGGFEHQWTAGASMQWLGADGYVTVFPSSASAQSQSEMPKVDGKRFGIFVDDRIAFGDGRFALTPSVRFDWYDYTPKESGSFTDNSGYPIFGLPKGSSGTRFSPKLLATYDLNPNVQLFAQWGTTYRAPTMSELYLNFTNPSPGYAQVGNPDLKAETGNGFDIGANLGDSDFGGKVTAFYNTYRNWISSTALTPDPVNYPGLPFGIGSYENLAKVETYGIEATAHKLFENGIRLTGGLAYAVGKDTVADTYLRDIAPFKGLAGIGYEQETWGVNLTGIFVGKPRAVDLPSYNVANLTAWWEPEIAKGMRIQAGVYNLFDETYYDALALKNVTFSQPQEFYSQSGRSFRFSLTQNF